MYYTPPDNMEHQSTPQPEMVYSSSPAILVHENKAETQFIPGNTQLQHSNSEPPASVGIPADSTKQAGPQPATETGANNVSILQKDLQLSRNATAGSSSATPNYSPVARQAVDSAGLSHLQVPTLVKDKMEVDKLPQENDSQGEDMEEDREDDTSSVVSMGNNLKARLYFNI
jgi:hypothetical protein